MEEKLRGVFAPITTPFTAEGEVNYEGLAKNVRAYARAGLKGFLALGSNGENKSLTNEEKLKVLDTIASNKTKEQVVMAGCIFESTFETIDMARKMEQSRPDYLTLLPPSYFKKQMTDDVLYKYFTDVADAVKTPCLVYNAPQYAGGVGLSVGLIKRVASHSNILGIKDSSAGNMESILFAVRDKFTVVSGSVNNFFQCMTMGGAGGVLSFADAFPAECLKLYNLLDSKRYDEAIPYYDFLLRVSKVIGGKGGVAAVKYAMDLNGFVGGDPRLPLMPLEQCEQEAIEQTLSAEGMLTKK
ncbi:MAG TPA: dihydrodipicolinate synthase family protein [Clostridia bacterium]|nr:dihydrodipicolinate synthase family protein [Clostridia bacterium]